MTCTCATRYSVNVSSTPLYFLQNFRDILRYSYNVFPSSFLGGYIERRVLVASYETLAGLIDVTTGSLAVGDPFCTAKLCMYQKSLYIKNISFIQYTS